MPKNAAWTKEAGANTLDELRALSTEQILAVTAKKNGFRFRSVIDGKFLSEPVLDTYKSGKQAKVPLLAGFNRDEDASLAMGMTRARSGTQWRNSATPTKQMSFSNSIRGLPMRVAMRSAADFGGDQFIAYGTWKWMEIDRKTGNKNIYPLQIRPRSAAQKSHWASQASSRR